VSAVNLPVWDAQSTGFDLLETNSGSVLPTCSQPVHYTYTVATKALHRDGCAGAQAAAVDVTIGGHDSPRLSSLLSQLRAGGPLGIHSGVYDASEWSITVHSPSGDPLYGDSSFGGSPKSADKFIAGGSYQNLVNFLDQLIQANLSGPSN